jgi:hypothetical protein
MSLSLKRWFSLVLCAALVAGVVPSACYEAVAANMGRTPPSAGSGINARALPQSAMASQSGAAAGATRAPQRVPVAIEVSPEVTQTMTAEQKADLAKIAELMQARLFTWDEVAIKLPGTIFDNAGKPIVSSEDLFQSPQANELERLARKYPKLTAQMRAQLYKDGTFPVPSEDFKGQTHVFQTADLLQQGYEKSRAILRLRAAGSAEHWFAHLPRTLKGGTGLSLDRTLRNVGEGLHETAGLLYGMRETRPTHDESSIDQKRREMLGLVMANELPNRDTFLYNEKAMEKAEPLLAKAQEKADASWKAKAEAVAEELGKTIKDPQQLADAIAQARQQEIYTALAGNAELEALHEGLGALVIQRLKYMQAKQAILDEATRAVRAHGETVRAKLRASNPILSLVTDWAEKKVSAAMAEYASKTKGRYEERLVKAAAELGLSEELSVESRFQKTFQTTRDAMLAETTAARQFSWERRIWSRKNWIVEKNEDGTFSGSQERVVLSTTKDLLWRAGNFFRRWRTLSNQLLYGLVNDTSLPIGGLLNGPLGWKAMVSAEPFPYKWRLDAQTGQWIESSARRNTYASRISGFYAQRRAMLDEYKNKPDHAFFLGKGLMRILFYFPVADIGLGLLAPVIVGIGQPVLTLVNTILSLTFAAATPLLLAPALSAGVWAFQAAVFDYAGTQYARWRSSIVNSAGLVTVAVILSLAWYFVPKLGGVAALTSWWVLAPALGALGLMLLFKPTRNLLLKSTPYLAGLAALAGALWYFGPKLGIQIDLSSGWWVAGLVALIAAEGPLFPWVGTLAKKAGIYGAAATIVSAGKAVLHAVAAPVLAVVSGVLWLGRRVWDNLMKPILAWRGRVPSQNSRFLRRVAGPGIGSEYFFQVSADLPVLAAWASMEASEMYRYDGEMKGLIAEPAKAYQEFEAVLTALTLGSNQGRSQAPAYKQIAEKEEANLKNLSEEMRPRVELYGKLLKVPAQNHIKLSAADLTTLLKKTAVLAENFYGKVIKDQAWSAEKIAAFWKGKSLAANDWVGLAKQLQGAVFGDAILTPFEESDKTLRISVETPGLEDYIKGLDSGIMPGQLDNVTVGDLGRPQEKPSVNPTVPVVRASDLGGGML